MEIQSVTGARPIHLFRGDTKTITFVVYKKEIQMLPDELKGMIAVLTVRDRWTQDIIFQKETAFDSSVISIYLSHEETKDIKPGEYMYDLKIKKQDNSSVYTVLKEIFYVESDVMFER